MKLRNFTLAFVLMLVSNFTFAGGGGGGSQNASFGAGGTGGGGRGAASLTANQVAGTANTGGGGGGGITTAAAGGSGVVILSVPTANYPGTYTGTQASSYPKTSGSNTVLYWTGSGTYTA